MISEKTEMGAQERSFKRGKCSGADPLIFLVPEASQQYRSNIGKSFAVMSVPSIQDISNGGVIFLARKVPIPRG